MGMCLDTEDCTFRNLDKARFCAKCGIPLQGSLLQERYEIQGLIGKDQSTITLSAIDHREELPVTLRALQPNMTSEEERNIFLQDAELAFELSGSIDETGNIRVIDYGQDGPITFLVKSELPGQPHFPDTVAQSGKIKEELDELTEGDRAYQLGNYEDALTAYE